MGLKASPASPRLHARHKVRQWRIHLAGTTNHGKHRCYFPTEFAISLAISTVPNRKLWSRAFAPSWPKRRFIVPAMPAHRQADVRAHDQLRPARLGDGQGARLSLPARRIRSPASLGRRCRSHLLDIWRTYRGHRKEPEACLVNFYADDARMGLHQDRDEQDLETPVVSISLGRQLPVSRRRHRTAAIGTLSFKLSSGDIVVLGGEGRLAFHGVDRSIRHVDASEERRAHQPDAPPRHP